MDRTNRSTIEECFSCTIKFLTAGNDIQRKAFAEQEIKKAEISSRAYQGSIHGSFENMRTYDNPHRNLSSDKVKYLPNRDKLHVYKGRYTRERWRSKSPFRWHDKNYKVKFILENIGGVYTPNSAQQVKPV